MPRSPLSLIGLALAVTVACLAGFYFLPRPARNAAHGGGAEGRPADAPRREAPATIAALGRLEPRGGVIDVGGTTGERIERLVVAEGDEVRAGQELAFLASYELRKSEQQLAEIQLREAQARHAADVQYGAAVVAEAAAASDQLQLADLDLKACQAKIELADLNRAVVERDLERLEAAGEKLVSSQELDHQRLLADQARAECRSARAQLAKLEAAREANRREAQARLATAQASQLRLQNASSLESLQQGLAAARQKVELSIIRAPAEGRVLRVITLAGETIGQRPILLLGDTAHMYAAAEVYETDERYLRVGQRATVTSDALASSLSGTVESVGVTVAKNEVVSLNPSASADARVVVARIRLDDSQPASRLVDLQVDVLIDTSAPAQTMGRAPAVEARGG